MIKMGYPDVIPICVDKKRFVLSCGFAIEIVGLKFKCWSACTLGIVA
jgi:hypothetical protein